MDFEDIVVDDLGRMSGGASKEQFSFRLKHKKMNASKHYVLRMDPLEGIVETCRLREAELLSALAGVVAVPSVLAVDPEGEHLGRPGVITEFISGVTAPSTLENNSVSGIGISYDSYAKVLAPQFVKLLVNIHSWKGWNSTQLPNYIVPNKGTNEAALYQVNLWAKAWEIDKVEPVSMITLAENWLRENAPICEEPCLLHCDYRIGNFLFEEPSGEITSILDWELAHFGDFHEDLAWVLHKLFGSWNEDGEFLVCCLMTRDEFISQYQKLAGRKINTNTLRYYEILNAWKCALMGLSSAITAAQNNNNHQDWLITWLGSAGAVHLDHMITLLKEAN